MKNDLIWPVVILICALFFACICVIALTDGAETLQLVSIMSGIGGPAVLVPLLVRLTSSTERQAEHAQEVSEALNGSFEDKLASAFSKAIESRYGPYEDPEK